MAFMIALLAPAIYIALVNFHQELIPTNLIISIAAAREGVPFPVVVETIGMVIVFYLLREASTRMPRALVQGISIVGALVIGQYNNFWKRGGKKRTKTSSGIFYAEP